ncbi:hypothetical protein GGR56DRAFT_561277 [Xylariaceae sp. FL0804]|nr:hypothetical protein GGR56DRAFT_561277 [Xylariaceae sp. FL0804]
MASSLPGPFSDTRTAETTYIQASDPISLVTSWISLLLIHTTATLTYTYYHQLSTTTPAFHNISPSITMGEPFEHLLFEEQLQAALGQTVDNMPDEERFSGLFHWTQTNTSESNRVEESELPAWENFNELPLLQQNFEGLSLVQQNFQELPPAQQNFQCMPMPSAQQNFQELPPAQHNFQELSPAQHNFQGMPMPSAQQNFQELPPAQHNFQELPPAQHNFQELPPAQQYFQQPPPAQQNFPELSFLQQNFQGMQALPVEHMKPSFQNIIAVQQGPDSTFDVNYAPQQTITGVASGLTTNFPREEMWQHGNEDFSMGAEMWPSPYGPALQMDNGNPGAAMYPGNGGPGPVNGPGGPQLPVVQQKKPKYIQCPDGHFRPVVDSNNVRAEAQIPPDFHYPNCPHYRPQHFERFQQRLPAQARRKAQKETRRARRTKQRQQTKLRQQIQQD